MAKLQKLKPGRRPTTEDYNKLVGIVNALMNLKGRNGITVNSTPHGTTLTGIGVGSTVIRRSYVKAAPTASSNEVTCFLDTDETGEEITVSYARMISGDTNLDNSFPPLVDGLQIHVFNDLGTWKPLSPIGVLVRCP